MADRSAPVRRATPATSGEVASFLGFGDYVRLCDADGEEEIHWGLPGVGGRS